MPRVKDLVGQKFGRLTVLYRSENTNGGEAKWHCKCDCGNEVDVISHHLRYGNTKSCGCLLRESSSIRNRRSNEYSIHNDYIIAKTSSGIEFIVDKDDEWVFDEYCWCANGKRYLHARNRKNGGNIFLHRLIMGCEDGFVVDHINGNIFDNRKCNLRIVTTQQNSMNQRAGSRNTSGVIGVSYNKARHKWVSQIGIGGNRICIGRFDSFDDAVAARLKAEEKYFGEYAATASRAVNL